MESHEQPTTKFIIQHLHERKRRTLPDVEVNDDHAYKKDHPKALILTLDSKFDGEKAIKVKILNKTLVVLPDFLADL